MVCLGIAGGILLGLLLDGLNKPVVEVALAETVVVEEVKPIVVMLEIKVDWTRERIIKEIRDTFPEAPNTAVAIFKCESGLKADIQSGHILSYGREQSFGVTQIHARDWHNKAMKLGFTKYRTDPGDNLKMARYIYNGRGNFKDWSCYNNGGYKQYL